MKTNQTTETLKARAKAILDEFTKQGVQAGESSLTQSTLTEVCAEGGKLSMLRSNLSDHGKLKILQGGKKGQSDLTDFSDPRIREGVATALELSEVSQSDPAEGISELQENQDFVVGPQDADTEKMLDSMQGLIQSVKEEYPKVSFDMAYLSHMLEDQVYANTNGVVLSERRGYYRIIGTMVARDGDKTTSFDVLMTAFASFDKPLIEQDGVRRKVDEITSQLDARQFTGKFEGDVILPPDMFVDVFYNMQQGFLSDMSLISGKSIWKEKLGQQVAIKGLNVSIDPGNSLLASGSMLTSDGYVAKAQPLIQDGNLASFALSRYGAAKTGLKRAGNDSMNFIVDAGKEKLEDMIASVERGLLLKRFSGGGASPAGDLSGVAKNSFIIEDGKIAYPVSETMVTSNVARMLMEIKALSEVRENIGRYLIPWAKIGGVTISGK